MEMQGPPFEVNVDDIEIALERNCKDLSMDENENLEKVVEPMVGMSFDSEVEARDYYASYAKSKGFVVITRTSKKREDGQKTNITYSCHRGGKPRTKSLNPVKSHLTAKTRCKASMNIFFTIDHKWMLNSIELNHNHELCPNKAQYLKFNRIIPSHAKRTFELNGSVGTKINKTISSSVIEAGGPHNLTWLETDAKNYLDKVRHLELKEGDAEAMHKFFIKMQANNENFFYAMDLDDENRLRNVFWADARSRAAFKEFGDVVTFDTTYLVNKHDMPFAPFVGVNHHGQSILFGCGLVSREDTVSFVWLFETWLACMFGCAPNAIITNQCRAMQKAISIVFPVARHRWCLWHILKKFPEKLKGYKAYEPIKSGLHNAIYDSLNEQEFEAKWGNVIAVYELAGNEWLTDLYEERHRWVPAFVKNIFWAGMSTTQQSESVNAFFDGYIHSNTTLKQFVEQYENVLSSKVQKEEEEDAHCLNMQVKNISPYGFENQFQEAYTIAKCKDFQAEVAGKIACQINSVKVVYDLEEFEIEEDIQLGDTGILKSVGFHVRFDESSKDTSCTCRLFEFKGIVCKHIFVVWSKKKLTRVPDKYVLRRWRKDVSRSHNFVKVTYANWERKPECLRYDMMLDAFYRVADKAFQSVAKSERVMSKLLEAKEENKDFEEVVNVRHDSIPRKSGAWECAGSECSHSCY